MTQTLDLAHLPGLGPRLARIAPIVAAWLRNECRGRQAARPKWACVGILRVLGLSISQREFEGICHALAVATGDLGTSTRGYYWCVEEEDYDLAAAWLAPRFEPQRERHQAIRRRRAERFGGPKLF